MAPLSIFEASQRSIFTQEIGVKPALGVLSKRKTSSAPAIVVLQQADSSTTFNRVPLLRRIVAKCSRILPSGSAFVLRATLTSMAQRTLSSWRVTCQVSLGTCTTNFGPVQCQKESRKTPMDHIPFCALRSVADPHYMRSISPSMVSRRN